jgi:Uma2 family endonuclease
MLGVHADRRTNQCWIGADLVVEVISESNKNHDLRTKRAEYAAAGIPEYSIIDPDRHSIRILTLAGHDYIVHADFAAGQTATSVALDGLAIVVDDLFTAADAQA